MIKYLIIGAQGTLGSEFKKLLPKDECMAVSRTELDITNELEVYEFFKKNNPKIVINCAAYTDVDGAESNYNIALSLNSEVLKTLSKACNEIGSKLIHFSTGMVFKGDEKDGYTESSLPDPVNKYGDTKLKGENIIRDKCEDYYIVRTEWLYGKPQTDSAKKSFIEQMILLGKSGKVKGVTDEIGKPTWTKDLAEAVVELINSEKPVGIYHLTNEGQASRLGWAKKIYEITGMDVKIEPVLGKEFPRPAKRPKYELLINNKLPRLRSWEDALKDYLTNT